MPGTELLQCLQHRTNRGVKDLVAVYEAIWELGAQLGRSAGGESRGIAFEELIYPSEAAVVSAAHLMAQHREVGLGDAVSRILHVPIRHSSATPEAQAMLLQLLPSTQFSPKTDAPTRGLTPWQQALADRIQQSLSAGNHSLLIGRQVSI